jgi:hypothetical protein
VWTLAGLKFVLAAFQALFDQSKPVSHFSCSLLVERVALPGFRMSGENPSISLTTFSKGYRRDLPVLV